MTRGDPNRLDEEDLSALLERTRDDNDHAEIAKVVADLRWHRNTGRQHAREQLLMMAAAIGSELTHEMATHTEEGRELLALRSVQIALAIEKATPR